MRCTQPQALDSARSRGQTRAWLSGLLVVAQLLSFVHFAFVEHRLCALHGKLVHVKRVAGRATAARGPMATAQSTEGDAGQAHDHCRCPAAGGESFVLGPFGHFGGHGSFPSVANGVSIASTPVQSIALLALAPKSSPPV